MNPHRSLFALLVLGALVACEPPVVHPVSFYEKAPEKRTATIDGVKITVVRQMGNGYVAWGGGKESDQWAQYKQRRAIELVSGCLVHDVVSKKTDPVYYAFVQCD